MKAALFYGEKDIRVEDRYTPEPGRDEVLIGIKSAGGAGKALADLGYTNVRNLGGFKDWVEAGGAIEKD